MNNTNKYSLIYLGRFVFQYAYLAKSERPLQKMVLLLLMIAFSASLMAASPVALKYAVDGLTGHVSADAYTPVILIGLFVLSQGLVRLTADAHWAIYGGIEQIIHKHIRVYAIGRACRLPLEKLTDLGTGHLSQGINNGTRGASMFMQAVLQGFLPIALQLLAVTLVISSFYDIHFALILSAGVALYVFAFAKGTNSIIGKNRKAVAGQNLVSGAISDALIHPETNKYLGADRDLSKCVGQKNAVTQSAWKEYYKTALSNGAITSLLYCLTLGAISFLAYFRVSTGTMTTGDFVMLVTYVIQLVKPIEAIGYVFRDIGKARVMVEDFDQLLSGPSENDSWGGKNSFKSGPLEFSNVSFSYGKDEIFQLKDVSFKLPVGGTLAIVGESGSGKSTIIRLIAGLYKPTRGNIYIGGVDISRINLEQLRVGVSVVPQDTALYNMSIWENIAIGTSADRAEAIRAAKSVGIDDFISSLAEGYDTVVGERGAKLSTGQRQRIGIARLALRDSSVILLDEPTSALDSMNEQSLLSVVSSSFGGKTIVMIAHRLKSIAGADCILVMRDGQIVEHGTHEQLIDRGNYYFELWNAQNNSAIFAQG